ncbi:MAG TPA: 16S rRNA (uracil(1498)-N(3))-methyltransferase [Clostridiales bacterium]|nr:16S rRNA (uracil(1498)-N(3))-methyltransferase [Clostridiales bacterium]HPP36840.1 16S rRNA (uracil(1498)-N(3))-methyltransferase [Clostridiales bacterium]
MARFFVKTDPADLDNGRITITGPDVNHITNVLRASKGDTLVLCDGAGTDYDVVIDQVSREKIGTVIMGKRASTTEPPVGITLFQGIPKADKMDYIIQKCVELGVRRIVPVLASRSVVRFGTARDAAAKTARWNRISLEAAKQCDRGIVPEVYDPVKFDEALELADGHGLKLFPYEEEKEGSLRKVLQEHRMAMMGSSPGIAVFIGPEGGFDPEEAEKAVKSGFKPVTLGPRILRTETAGIAVAAIVMYELGDMGGPGAV